MLGTQKFNIIKINGASSEFHTYKLDWTPRYIRVSIDGAQLFEFRKDQNADLNRWPFDNDFNIILNTAVGGK
jgi:beta-glucanase (GH16 family)